MSVTTATRRRPLGRPRKADKFEKFFSFSWGDPRLEEAMRQYQQRNGAGSMATVVRSMLIKQLRQEGLLAD